MRGDRTGKEKEEKIEKIEEQRNSDEIEQEEKKQREGERERGREGERERGREVPLSPLSQQGRKAAEPRFREQNPGAKMIGQGQCQCTYAVSSALLRTHSLTE